MNFRDEAFRAARRARLELESDDDNRAKYAALELRFALEALTYDKALQYKDDFPPSEFETWQPRKVMATLLEIDPDADKDVTIAIGLQKGLGQPASDMQSLGSEKKLSLANLKAQYDALGNYLHAPSLKQVTSGTGQDIDRLRERCVDVLKCITEIEASPVWGTKFSNIGHAPCGRCGHEIRRNLGVGQQGPWLAYCPGCKAPHDVSENEAGQIRFTPRQKEMICSSCKTVQYLWTDQVIVGNLFNCCECETKFQIVLALREITIHPETQ